MKLSETCQNQKLADSCDKGHGQHMTCRQDGRHPSPPRHGPMAMESQCKLTGTDSLKKEERNSVFSSNNCWSSPDVHHLVRMLVDAPVISTFNPELTDLHRLDSSTSILSGCIADKSQFYLIISFPKSAPSSVIEASGHTKEMRNSNMTVLRLYTVTTRSH